MFGNRIPLGRLFGFPIALDASWFVLAFLVTWSLGAGYFPGRYPGLDPAIHWIMGASAAIGLFASILLHEIGHALMAREHGLEIRGITLFIFGGVAELSEELPSARAEFQVAIAGPVASALIAGAAWAAAAWAETTLAPVAVGAVAMYLAVVNLMIVAFNLVPAMPLDGGRILRAAIWAWKGDLQRATTVSSTAGSLFGLLLIGVGVFAFATGNPVGGAWWVLIGLFLRSAAGMARRQMLMRRMLDGERVARLMRADPVVVQRALSVQQLVDEYLYGSDQSVFPVVEGDRLVGCVGIEEVRRLPREEWSRQSVSAILRPCRELDTISEDADALEALAALSRTPLDRLLVTRGRSLVGVLSGADLLAFFERKRRLEPEGI